MHCYLPITGNNLGNSGGQTNPMSGAINMGGFGINSISNPVNQQDAVTLNYLTAQIAAIFASTYVQTILTVGSSTTNIQTTKTFTITVPSNITSTNYMINLTPWTNSGNMWGYTFNSGNYFINNKWGYYVNFYTFS